MRSMSGLYFFSMIGLFIFAAALLIYMAFGGDNIYISDTFTALFMTVIVAISRPYQKMYMNITDVLLLSCLTMKYLAMATKLLKITRILLYVPAISLIVMITLIKMNHFTRYLTTQHTSKML